MRLSSWKASFTGRLAVTPRSDHPVKTTSTPTEANAPFLNPGFGFKTAHIRRTRFRHPIPCASGKNSAGQPFPFCREDYYQATLQYVHHISHATSGFLILMRQSDDGSIDESDKALVVAVAGDTLSGITLLMQGIPAAPRPMSLDLLWSILERGHDISKKEWKLLKVAVTELRGDTYIGRLFFGDPANDAVRWDCDSRPSDAIWLSLKSACPIYIHKLVWDANATPLVELAGSGGGGGGSSHDTVSQSQPEYQSKGTQQQHPPKRGGPGHPIQSNVIVTELEQGAHLDPLDPMSVMLQIQGSDPEVIKRLKMEFKVALKDENFEAAVRLRDHPFMKCHLEAVLAHRRGELKRSSVATARLHQALQKYEETGVVEPYDDSIRP